MSLNWANNLDMLAQNGVLDFDAPSYIMGQSPRYVGNPVNPDPFNGQPPAAAKLNQSGIDEFKPEKGKNDIAKTPAWKKWAFGALAAGALAFGGFKFKSKIVPFFKKAFKKINLQSAKKFVNDKSKSVGKFFKNGWNKFTGLFSKKAP